MSDARPAGKVVRALTFAKNMKNTTLNFLLASWLLVSAGSENPRVCTIVAAEISYSHPDEIAGEQHKPALRVEMGAAKGLTPGGGQTISLKNDHKRSYSRRIDATDPNMTSVTVQTEMEGVTSESRALEFTNSSPNGPAIAFKNGLRAV